MFLNIFKSFKKNYRTQTSERVSSAFYLFFIYLFISVLIIENEAFWKSKMQNVLYEG